MESSPKMKLNQKTLGLIAGAVVLLIVVILLIVLLPGKSPAAPDQLGAAFDEEACEEVYDYDGEDLGSFACGRYRLVFDEETQRTTMIDVSIAETAPALQSVEYVRLEGDRLIFAAVPSGGTYWRRIPGRRFIIDHNEGTSIGTYLSGAEIGWLDVQSGEYSFFERFEHVSAGDRELFLVPKPCNKKNQCWLQEESTFDLTIQAFYNAVEGVDAEEKEEASEVVEEAAEEVVEEIPEGVAEEVVEEVPSQPEENDNSADGDQESSEDGDSQ